MRHVLDEYQDADSSASRSTKQGYNLFYARTHRVLSTSSMSNVG